MSQGLQKCELLGERKKGTKVAAWSGFHTILPNVVHAMFKASTAPSSPAVTSAEHGKHAYFYCAGEDKASIHNVLDEVALIVTIISVTLIFHVRFDPGALSDVWDVNEYELHEDDDEGGATITIQSLIDIGLLSKKDKALTSKQILNRDDQYVTFQMKLDGTDKDRQEQRGVFVPLTQVRRDRVRARFAESSQAPPPIDKEVNDEGDRLALFSLELVALYSPDHPPSIRSLSSRHALRIRCSSSSNHPLFILHSFSARPSFILFEPPLIL
jgi:hypothetical protein